MQGYSDAEIPSISASEIRGRVGREEDLVGLVAEEVEDYVKERGLYSKADSKT